MCMCTCSSCVRPIKFAKFVREKGKSTTNRGRWGVKSKTSPVGPHGNSNRVWWLSGTLTREQSKKLSYIYMMSACSQSSQVNIYWHIYIKSKLAFTRVLLFLGKCMQLFSNMWNGVLVDYTRGRLFLVAMFWPTRNSLRWGKGSSWWFHEWCWTK